MTASKHPLQIYREREGLTQEALAKQLGVEPPTISRWELGRRTPRGEDLRRICSLTGLSPAAVLGMTEPAA